MKSVHPLLSGEALRALFQKRNGRVCKCDRLVKVVKREGVLREAKTDLTMVSLYPILSLVPETGV